MDLVEDAAPGGNAPEFTVSEISGAVKRVIEGEFGRVRIRGECGRVMVARSGHVYLDLKDDRAVLSSVIWKGQAARLAVKPEEGMEVVAIGRLTTFPGQSRYQMVIEDIRPAGVGALMAMLEKRKAQLQAEGLFAAERKRALPYLPEVIGVVTSPQGAVIRDILHRLRDRFPRKVLIWPVAVQGDGCAPQVTAAIKGFNALTPGGAVPRPDVLIVARGGGSIEDLWGFNEESVARAAAASEIPLISAVGHETDTTLIDYVSDQRAPTPTAAAEMAVPVRLDLLAVLDSHEGRLITSMTGAVARRKQRLADLARALPRPAELTGQAAQRLDAVALRLPGALRAARQAKALQLQKAGAPLRPGLLMQRLEAARQKLERAGDLLSRGVAARRDGAQARFQAVAGRLNLAPVQRELRVQRQNLDRTVQGLSRAARADLDRRSEAVSRLARLRDSVGYEATLARGYAVVWDGKTVVTTKTQAAQSKSLEVQFRDGRFALGKQTRSAKAKSGPAAQKSLFDEPDGS